jgi:hypothetical protein
LRLIDKPEQLVGPGVVVLRLLRHFSVNSFSGYRPILPGLARVAFVLGHHLIVVVEDSDF